MKSIRRSLAVYFVCLLTIALGAVALLVSWQTDETLRAEQEVKEKLIEARYKAQQSKEKTQLDHALLSQARSLSNFLRFHYDQRAIWFATSGPHRASSTAGFLSSAFMPYGYVTAPVWKYQNRSRSVWTRYLHHASKRVRPTQIRIEDGELLQPINKDTEEFFQVNSSWGATYFSPNMEGRTFAFDPAALKGGSKVDWSFETVKLGKKSVRVVKLKIPPPRRVPLPRIGSGKRSRRREHHRSFSPWSDRPHPALYIQYASEMDEHRAALAALKSKRDEELLATKDETATSQASVRKYLLVLLGTTFVLGVMGCFWFVRLGLAPLRRLSEAVSRISEKDFRLHFDGERIPGEVTPIVERLTSTLEMLKRAFAREKQATADISHDLRTPVAALLTTVDFALRKPRSAEEYREALVECRLSGQQMNQIVEQLLNLARLDAGVAQLQAQPVNVSELAEQCVALVRPLAESRGLSVSFQGAPTEPIRTDAAKLREVMNNLLQNAIQYNQPNGSISVVVHHQDGQLELQVSDTGIGIPSECHTMIFERFYRADPSRHSDDINVGLGLAIVQGYVDLMGGKLSLQSAEGEGSTFRIYLPA